MKIPDWKIFNNLDVVFARLGLVFSLIGFIAIIILFNQKSYRFIEVPLALFFASLLYLVIKKYFLSDENFPYLIPQKNQKFQLYLINIGFFFIFAVSCIIFFLRPDTYERPIAIFFLTSVMAGVLAYEIIISQNTNAHHIIILVKILIFALFLRIIPQLLFTDLIGIDSLVHSDFANLINSLGHIPEGYSYSSFPIMHLIIDVFSLVSGIGYKFSSIITIAGSQVFLYLFIFLICSLLKCKKVGLFAILLLATSDIQISHSLIIRPITLVFFIPIIIYLIFKINNKKNAIYWSLIILLCVILLLSHAIASLSMGLILSAITILFLAIDFTNSTQDRKTKFVFYLSVFFFVAMMAWWMYSAANIAMTQIGRLFDEGFSISHWQYSESAIDYLAKYKVEYMLNVLGFHIFYGLSFIGSFFLLQRKNFSKLGLSIVLVSWFLVSLIFLSIVSGFTILQGRWQDVSQLISAIPAALGILFIPLLIKNTKIQSLIIILMISSIAFLMVTNPVSNIDTSVYSPNTIVRYAFTDSEYYSAKLLEIYDNNNIGTDLYYAKLFSKGKDDTEIIFSKDYKNIQNMIVIRQEIVNNPFYYHGTTKLGFDPRIILEQTNLEKVFDAGKIQGYTNN
jgi:hypothetical protein